jgi:hypothetical protein
MLKRAHEAHCHACRSSALYVKPTTPCPRVLTRLPSPPMASPLPPYPPPPCHRTERQLPFSFSHIPHRFTARSEPRHRRRFPLHLSYLAEEVVGAWPAKRRRGGAHGRSSSDRGAAVSIVTVWGGAEQRRGRGAEHESEEMRWKEEALDPARALYSHVRRWMVHSCQWEVQTDEGWTPYWDPQA